jgi:predicted phage tail protein
VAVHDASASATYSIASTNAAPGEPRSLAASVSGSRVTLSWQPPSAGGAPSTYLLYVGTASGASDVANAYNVGNVLSVYGDLQRGTYYARVRASNAYGTSLDSTEVRFNIGRRLRTPGGFTVTWTGTTAALSWTAPAADSQEDVPTSYVLEAGTRPGASDVARLNVGNTTVFRVTIASGTYYVRVRAQNAQGESEPSEEIVVSPPGNPHAPTVLSVGGLGATVELQWAAPGAGSAPTGYVIEAGTAPGLADIATLPVGNVTRFVTTAPPGVYYVRVRSVNGRGASPPSNEIVVRR